MYTIAATFGRNKDVLVDVPLTKKDKTAYIKDGNINKLGNHKLQINKIKINKDIHPERSKTRARRLPL